MDSTSPFTDALHDAAAGIVAAAITIVAIVALASPFAIAIALALPFVG